jgi:translation initiation factor 1 (eIF-1/SUI1)
MNPFEDINENIFDTKISIIEIWVGSNGRKKNTYISNWDIPIDQLKDHLKIIKKKNACNGSVKEIPNELQTKLIKILQFQGDHLDYVHQYLIQNKIDPSYIRIKG